MSLPEVPSLAVLPGTGGLTRLVDKRHVRRDLADVFSTLAEGVRGQRALDWRLVDELSPRSRFEQSVAEAAEAAAKERTKRAAVRVSCSRRSSRGAKGTAPSTGTSRSQHRPRRRVAELTVRGAERIAAAQTAKRCADWAPRHWGLRAFRELDDALLDLRHNHPDIGVIALKTAAIREAVLEHDRALVGAACRRTGSRAKSCSGSDARSSGSSSARARRSR